MADIPDDVDDALNFWADEAGRALTENAPRDKWQRILNARLLGFELSKKNGRKIVLRRTTNCVVIGRLKPGRLRQRAKSFQARILIVARQRQKLSPACFG